MFIFKIIFNLFIKFKRMFNFLLKRKVKKEEPIVQKGPPPKPGPTLRNKTTNVNIHIHNGRLW